MKQNTTHHYFCVEQEESKQQFKEKSISLIRDKFKSVTCLPSYLQSPANLATFPGDKSHEELLKMEKENPNLSRINDPAPAPNPVEYDYDYDTDSDKLSDILEDDLERGSAVLAAFVVTLITMTFFVTLVTMISITVSVSGDYQVRNIKAIVDLII